MILDCPKCHAKYNIADSMIPAVGRNVRCASCGHYWFQKSPTSLVLKPDINGGDNYRMKFEEEGRKKPNAPTTPRFGNVEKKPHELVREKAFSKAKLLHYSAISVAWLTALTFMVGGILYGVANREMVVKKWPNSASFFALLGARANTYGLEITKVQVRAGQDTEGQRLVIAGVIKSTSYVAKPVPYLRITLVDDHNKKVASWLADPGITIITPMAEQPFESIRRPIPQGNLRAIVVFNDPPSDLPNGKEIASKKKDTLMGSAGTSNATTTAAPEGTTHAAPDTHAAAPAAPVEHAAETSKKEDTHNTHNTAVGR